VAFAILAKIAFFSDIFIGLIFFGGSIFVWLGIVLQHRMIAMIQIRYEQARQATERLEREHLKLEAANSRLNSEVGERRRAEADLNESEQRLNIILDQLPTGILIIDENTKIIKDANSVALKNTGLPLEEVVGAVCHEFVCPEQSHLLKALMNLVSNAAESMPDGGTVLIDVDNRYVDRPIKGYDTVEEGDYVVLAVIDSGIGIAPEDQERIFEPFHTIKKAGTQRNRPGHGGGLGDGKRPPGIYQCRQRTGARHHHYALLSGHTQATGR
jgi:PAS domain S-box-containing protein